MASEEGLTIKHRTFVRSPMCTESGEWRDIVAVPGIGPMAANAFSKSNFTKAHHILGIMLTMDLEEEPFKLFLRQHYANMTSHSMQACYAALADWIRTNMR